MTSVKAVHKVLKDIDKLCGSITRRAYATSIEIEKCGKKNSHIRTHFVSKGVTEVSTPSGASLINKMKEVVISTTELALIVRPEISSFSLAVISNDMKPCPFMEKVWRGDAYGEPGVAGLEALKTELLENFDSLEIDTLLAKMVPDLNPPHDSSEESEESGESDESESEESKSD